MKISSNNEWGELKSVVVGDATYANKPEGLHFDKPGPYRGEVTAQAQMDLNKFVRVLEHEGVKVYRPREINFVMRDGMYNYCPRDRLLVVGKTVIDCNMQYPCREMEINAYSEVLKKAKVIKVPRDKGIMFDAANVCRLNDTLLYLISPSGNYAGAEWLQEQFPKLTVETTETYSGIHIDSTFTPVREGLVVINKDRVTPETLPKCFKDWEVIWLGNEDLKRKNFAGEAFASNYIQLNFMMINPELAVIDDTPVLQQELAKRGVQSYVVPFAHSRTLGGGHHCCTLDLHRR